MEEPIQIVIDAALAARGSAYAPYSGYAVGAAVMDSEGRVFFGANVENASYPATICAERSAIAAMVSAGSRAVARIAVATKDGAMPCGICLQTIWEFAEDPARVSIYMVDQARQVTSRTLAELLPHGFRLRP